VEAANHGHPHGFQVAVTVVLETEEGAAEEAKKRLNHTFASYTRPSAFHLLLVLVTKVVRCNPARSICNVVSC
jgi:hypothetical protein